MGECGAEPHVTLAIWDTFFDVKRADAMLARFAAETAPMDVSLAAAGTFDDVVVYLTVVESRALREAQLRAHTQLARLTRGLWPHYAPSAWIPHCTIATELASDQSSLAMAVCAGLRLPISATLASATVVEFWPLRPCGSHPLVGQRAT